MHKENYLDIAVAKIINKHNRNKLILKLLNLLTQNKSNCKTTIP